MIHINSLDDKLVELRELFDSNQTKDVSYRKSQLAQLKKSLIKHEDAIYRAFKHDLHKCGYETYYTEYGLILSAIETMLKNMDKWLKPQSVKLSRNSFYSKTKVIKEPFGIVYIIGPFNYPLQLIMIPLIGAIASGNCAVVRASKRTPTIAKVIGDIIDDAFDSKYVVSIDPFVFSNKEVLTHRFDFIFFTGSSQVGKIILQAASLHLTPCVLELGGKSPAIVTEDANIELAAKQIVWSGFLNSGQTCISTDYVLVSRTNERLLIEEIKKEIVALYGLDIVHNDDYGRLVDKKATDRLIKLLTDNKDHLVYGGQYVEEDFFIEPTLFNLPLSRSSSLMSEEIFGPLLPIMAFDELSEAFEFVKKGPKPLAAYLFSEEKATQQRFIKELSFGGGGINQTILQISNDYSPFGGVGDSGMGNYHGQYSINTFTHEKTIVYDRKLAKRFEEIILPPYTPKKWKSLKELLK